ncbi:MAG TPA: hypothetical protein VH833_12040 [Gemmatimonadales bacterium]
MRRLHLFEIEDQSWCPRVLRDALTDYLGFVMDRFTPYAPAAPLLAQALGRCGASRVVDLCSGGGGPWVDLLRRLRALGHTALRVQVTDYYPNRAAFARLRELSGGAIEGAIEPVDATNVPAHLDGFRTMFTALHHFRPDVARRVLAGAVRRQRGIAVFEITLRSVLGIVGMVFFALGVLLFTPFIRPFRWSRLFWTYVIPVVPLLAWWDATVSSLRSYTVEELSEMAGDLGAGYVWDVGIVRVPLPAVSMTYLIGTPKPGGGA